jgi:hypothetical protein
MFPLRRIVLDNLSLILVRNYFLLDFTFLVVEYEITEDLFPWNWNVNSKTRGILF